jgi:hypothetical protein
MMREYFLNNRIKYLRGKYNSKTFKDGDRFEFRMSSISKEEGDNFSEEQQRINASFDAVPPSGDFNFKALKVGFAGVQVGANSSPITERFDIKDLNEEKTISVDMSSASGTETYLLGLSNLSSIGDLSNKYPYNLVPATGDNNLKSFILGNHHKDYYNPSWAL